MSPDPRVEATLDALVEEAYELAIKRGLAISKPEGWKRWKRSVYADTARREGPGYLRHHHQRLGLSSYTHARLACSKCGEPIVGNPITRRDDETAQPYCTNTCAGYQTITLDEFLATLDPEERRRFENLIRRRQEGAA